MRILSDASQPAPAKHTAAVDKPDGPDAHDDVSGEATNVHGRDAVPSGAQTQTSTGAALEANAQRPSEPGPRQIELTAGEFVRIASAGEITDVRKVDVAQAAVWRQRRLVFEESLLPEIAAEFNRYNRRPQLEVQGEAASRRFTGVFDADDPESLIELLDKDPHLIVERSEERVIVRGT